MTMKSLRDLNNYANDTGVEFEDDRDPAVIFDRDVAVNQTINAPEGESHIVPFGINIVEVIEYDQLNPYIQIDATTIPAGCQFLYDPVPDGITVSEVAFRVFKFSGINSAGIFNQLKRVLRLQMNNDFWGQFSYTITFGDDTSTELASFDVDVNIYNVISLSDPTPANYARGTTQKITGTPQVLDMGADSTTVQWSVTVTPIDYIDSVDSISTTSVQGTNSFDNTTKIFTAQGNINQVNDQLNNLYLTSTDTSDLTFTLMYQNTNEDSTETDTKYQTLTSTSVDLLGAVRGDLFYEQDTNFTIENGPLITDTAATSYTLEIQANPTSILENISGSSLEYRYLSEIINIDTVTNPSANDSWFRFNQIDILTGGRQTNNIAASSDGAVIAILVNSPTSLDNFYVYKYNTITDTYDQEYSTTVSDINVTNVFINEDGDRIILVGRESIYVLKYDTAWDWISYNGEINDELYMPTATTFCRSSCTTRDLGKLFTYQQAAFNDDIYIAEYTWNDTTEQYEYSGANPIIIQESVYDIFGGEFHDQDFSQIDTNVTGDRIAFNRTSSVGNLGFGDFDYPTVQYWIKSSGTWSKLGEVTRGNIGTTPSNDNTAAGFGATFRLNSTGLRIWVSDGHEPATSGGFYGGDWLVYDISTGSPTGDVFWSNFGDNGDTFDQFTRKYFGIGINRETNTFIAGSKIFAGTNAAFQSNYDINGMFPTFDNNDTVYTLDEEITANGADVDYTLQLKIHKSALEFSWDTVNKKLVITGTKSYINSFIDTLTANPTNDSPFDFELIYTLTTSEGDTTKRNQYVSGTY